MHVGTAHYRPTIGIGWIAIMAPTTVKTAIDIAFVTLGGEEWIARCVVLQMSVKRERFVMKHLL